MVLWGCAVGGFLGALGVVGTGFVGPPVQCGVPVAWQQMTATTCYVSLWFVILTPISYALACLNWREWLLGGTEG